MLKMSPMKPDKMSETLGNKDSPHPNKTKKHLMFCEFIPKSSWKTNLTYSKSIMFLLSM